MAPPESSTRPKQGSRRGAGIAVCLLAAAGAVAVHGASGQADAITVTVPGCVVNPIDLVGWWKGEDNLLAQIGPNLSGAVPFAKGLIGRGMSFDGASNAFSATFPSLTNAITVEMWVKPTRTGRVQALMSRLDAPSVDDSARTFSLLLDPNGRIFWTTDETSTQRPEELTGTVPAPFDIFDNHFHHVAATWDGSVMAVYFDGTLLVSQPARGGTLNPASTTQFRLGSQAGIGDPFYLTGILDEPAVINKALTATQINDLVAAGPNGLCVLVGTSALVGPSAQIGADLGAVDPVISSDGRYVVFRTRSSSVFPVVTNPLIQTPGQDLDLAGVNDDLVLIDRKGTAAIGDDTIELVSVDSNELGGGLDSFGGDITPSGSHVVFSSISDDLVPGDTLAGRDVFIRNRVAGTTERISVRSDGSQPLFTATGLNNNSTAPSVNDAGTVIAFQSTNRGLAPETNPVPGDTWQTSDIYVRDISDPNPSNRTTQRITVGIGDVKANGSSTDPIVSPDGRYVWFTSAASNLTAGDTNGHADLFVYDRQLSTTTRYDLTTATGLALDADAHLDAVSRDGRWIAFSSAAAAIVVGDTNGVSDAFRLDTQTNTVRRASANPLQVGGASFARSITDNGQHLVFQSSATNLVPDDTNATADLFVADLLNATTQRVSLETNGAQRTGSLGSASAVASGDGHTLLYHFQRSGESVFTIWEAKLLLP